MDTVMVQLFSGLLPTPVTCLALPTLQEKWVLIADRDSVFFDCVMVDITITFRYRLYIWKRYDRGAYLKTL